MASVMTTSMPPPLQMKARDAQVASVSNKTDMRKPSPPRADAVVSMIRSLTLDDDYFERRALRSICIQKTPVDDYHPQYSEIIPGLFVADMYTATSAAVIRDLGITHVVSVLKNDCPQYPRELKHVCVPIDDTRSAELLGHLDGITEWIQRALERGGQVMVHCVWGMSRSASVAIAFLMASRRLSLADAFRHVVSRRTIVRPNSGFMYQLRVYDQILKARAEKLKRLQRVFESMTIKDWN